MPELESALNLADELFLKTYGRNKPTPDAVVIFSCKAGGRAQRAAVLAKSLGYAR